MDLRSSVSAPRSGCDFGHLPFALESSILIVMKLSTHSQWVAGLLAATFLVFNVGLPAVLQWCPESKSTAACACSMTCCQPDVPTQRGQAAFTGPSCCSLLFAGEKNETEFVQGKPTGTECFKHHIVSGTHTLLPLTPSPCSAGFTASTRSVPFLSRDIPILVSSLLI